MRKYLLLTFLLLACSVNKVKEGENYLPKTKCLDDILHYEYKFVDEMGVGYYFYVPRFDSKTRLVKLCSEVPK